MAGLATVRPRREGAAPSGTDLAGPKSDEEPSGSSGLVGGDFEATTSGLV